ncbi:MAG: GNAT family N-acetyltransferase [Deltaproteobacteria bacterium]|nr:GNAT family N-acetyltransferase [Deltaproteobacteria bacterium]
MLLHAGHALAARLEACEGATCAAHVTTHAALDPACGAAVMEVHGVRAMFDGVGAPMTQTFGLGMLASVDDAALDHLEAFFRARGAAVHHEVCPLAGVELVARLVARGYRPIELSNVLVRGLDVVPPPVHGFVARVAHREEREAWVTASARGWSDDPATAAMIAEIGRVSFDSPLITPVAVLEGPRIVATGALAIHDRVALMAGASTIPEARGRGAQGALFAHRLELARERGAELAMMVAECGSGSQRNAERSGFRIAYTRTKWALA